ncbi:Nif3-like dinuclear metal center hexameric protein [Enterobacteriaceae endosymbiont of Neohaemonia nigricornis]|uniref:Nif3-like dinuclear metal center hexameric protein n=1 Tax=Enterobacteriaceae endosymbiont of Neohaemonia nigricornis TaxID=2675792 RepID=UPI001448B7EE|nr:Nif3-like dinuclear metal center hexameric protein [Enterobacteriaceae endosymbiont of Neohaemonia nigricornis]QJC30631.1 Nif3-like dinuclear metal center hexameric protein [Enterobacteriaceae endosymbiont of Neohaemonia nigricornis]
MNNNELELIINKKLQILKIDDYTINGLQVEGKKSIKRIITGVSICQKLLQSAIQYKADAIIVHHGLFWQNDNLSIKGIKKKRLNILLNNNINLYAWHLPLDIHPTLGNNIYLSKILNINVHGNINPFVFYGSFTQNITIQELIKNITQKLNRIPLHLGPNINNQIKNIAWCSGAGQKFFEEAIFFGIDVFITGEVSEMNFHLAKEYKVHFISAGHHATERGGIIMLSDWLKYKYNLDVYFLDINNPV